MGVSSTKLTTSTGAASIAATTCTLSAADADSYVNEASTGSNFGTATILDVRSSSSGDRRVFARFSLTSCSIPANSLIATANLKLFMSTAPSASRTYDAHRVSASWTETGVTWTNQPAVAASATSSVATGTTSNVTLTWAVTTDVQAFVDGTANNGWRIKDRTENSSTARSSSFRSAEYGTASQRPILEITYYP
ncbi:MAG: DNRLRE domain-containing protein [Gaiellaceae bacterium]